MLASYLKGRIELVLMGWRGPLKMGGGLHAGSCTDWYVPPISY